MKRSAKKSTTLYLGISKLLDTLTKAGLTAADLQVLHDLVTEDDDLRRITIISKELGISKLVVTGWLTGWDGQNGEVYQLTEKGTALLEEVNALFIKQKKQKIFIDIPSEKVLEITEIFPDIKGGSGKRLRCNLSETSSALSWFRKNYPLYDWDTIMQAAMLYVFDQEQENFKYCRRVKYFVRKMMQDKSWESDLAEYCEKVKSGDLGDRIENHFKEKIV